MRVRRFELRLLAAALTAGWALAAALVLIGYRPGGPIDLLVGLAAVPPVAIAATALAWPPVARGDRAFAATAWVGVIAMLLLLPSVSSLIEQLQAGGPQTLLPSLEAAYPWLVALGATALFTGLGIARKLLGDTALRRRRLFVGGILGSVMTLGAATAFTGVAVANDIALADQPAASSRFGPTDPSLDPPPCDGAIAAGSSARLQVSMSGSVDEHAIGTVQLSGTRDGSNVVWLADVATSLTLGRYGIARVGDRGWELRPGGRWQAVAAATLEADTVDLQVLATALTAGNRATAESLGIGYVEGARARHCRIAIDGPTFLRAFPQVGWLVGGDPITRWRGQLDYWVFGDGELGQVIASVNGEGAGLVPKGVLGTVRVTMTATDRGTAGSVLPPTP